MSPGKSRQPNLPLENLFLADRRDRRPGTHFAAELAAPKRKARRREEDDPHVDEDLGCSAFGIDLPFIKRE